MAKKKKMTAVEIAAQAEAMEMAEIQKAFEQGTNTLRDLISPSAIEIHSDYFRLGTKYGRTIYVYGYPRTLYTGWISPIINIDEVIDVSMYIYPVESAVVGVHNGIIENFAELKDKLLKNGYQFYSETYGGGLSEAAFGLVLPAAERHVRWLCEILSKP